MKNQNRRIPKIRFVNFNDKWNYKTLDEISNAIEYGINAPAKDFDGIHKYLRITDIDDTSRLFLTAKLSSPDVDFTEENYENYKLQKNDLLFARTGASVGKTYLYRESDGEVYYAGFLIRARLHDSYDGNFVFQQTFTDKYKQFIDITSQRSGQPGVNGKEYGDWKIGITSYSEQFAIGYLFRTFDDLLSNYKENLANYQSLKATMLSKMFPKDGQTVPEIRLDGFEGEWKEKEFSKLVKRVTQSSNSDSLPKVEFEDIVSGQGQLNKDISSKFDNRKGIHFKPGYTLYGKLRPYLNNWLLPKFEGVALGDFWVFDPNGNDSNFIYYLVQSNRYQKVANDTSGTKMPRSDWKSVSTTIFAIPQTITEQQAIGSYFSNLDNLINSHQEKISQLETLKKKLLQDMFI